MKAAGGGVAPQLSRGLGTKAEGGIYMHCARLKRLTFPGSSSVAVATRRTGECDFCLAPIMPMAVKEE